jgi:hypothetical protein
MLIAHKSIQRLCHKSSSCEAPLTRVTRIGWGYFTIDIAVVLKPGYLWSKGNKYDRTLILDWELDFRGFGSSASYEFAVAVKRGDF